MIKDIMESSPSIHTRDIRLSTCSSGPDRIVVEGILMDKRNIRVFDITGDAKPPGIIHHMGLWIEVSTQQFTITDIQAQMFTVPLPECRQTLDTLEKTIGLAVKPGFTRKIRQIMGGNTGCTHLCHLMTTMAQEVIHGGLTMKRQQPSLLPESLEKLQDSMFLVDSCRMWQKDGPRIKKLKQAIEKNARDPKGHKNGS